MLVATDFSEASDEAMDRAIEMAKQSSAAVEIIHVIELAEEFPFGTTHFEADYGALYANVDLHLARRADRFRQAGLACETKIVEGSAATEIAARGQGHRREPDRRRDARPHRPRARHAGQRRGACGQARLLPGPHRPLLAKGGLTMDTATAADNKIDPGARPDIRPRTKGALRVMESKGRILVVDDEVNARTALPELLRDEGYAVETAADAFKALGKIEEFAPDLVLTDLKMPGMDGIELLGQDPGERCRTCRSS